MDRNKLANNAILLTTAMIWGSSFPIRKMAEEYMTPLFFNSMRLYTGAAFVAVVMILTYLYRKRKSSLRGIAEKSGGLAPLSYQLLGGVVCGIVLSAGSICQQWGLYFTTAGKTGFITTLYTIFVPLISWLFLRKKINRQIWIGAGFAVAGLFFISAGSGFRLEIGDSVVFISAIFFALQILVINHYVQRTSALLLNAVQLATAATISLTASFFLESGNTPGAVLDAYAIILYAGVICLGVAYSLQTVALKHAVPSVAAIILSFESVFGALFGAIILGERMTGTQLLGCGLIFAAIIVAQYEWGMKKSATSRASAEENASLTSTEPSA